jgi:hypothetical protein
MNEAAEKGAGSEDDRACGKHPAIHQPHARDARSRLPSTLSLARVSW